MLDKTNYSILICPKCYVKPENENITKDMIYHCGNCPYTGKPLEVINSPLLRKEIAERKILLNYPNNLENIVDPQLKLNL